jgi:hypothetical protein
MANSYLNENNIDDLGRMVTALLSELWIVRDRMAILEKLLAAHNVLKDDEIDQYVPSPEFSAQIEQLRDRMVANVIGAPLAATQRGVDDILARAGLARPTPAP